MSHDPIPTPSYYIKLFQEWGKKRGIPTHSTALAQSRKTIEEVHELIEAAAKLDMIDQNKHRANLKEINTVETALTDAIGDVIVTLVQVAECAGFDITNCMAQAWNDIKDRKGAFGPDGTWVKEPQE